MKDTDIDIVVSALRKACAKWDTPAVTIVSERDRNPFTVLVSCIISLRTKDAVTAAATARLLSRGRSPSEIMELSVEDIAGLIYPAGFYRTKAMQILDICRRLVNDYAGIVPCTLEELLDFRGVGRKTANLVVTLGYGKPGICVDTHVHRIMNRLGYVSSRSPNETELILREKLPSQYWIQINDLLVCYGQNLCLPISPYCSKCTLATYCEKRGVGRSR